MILARAHLRPAGATAMWTRESWERQKAACVANPHSADFCDRMADTYADHLADEARKERMRNRKGWAIVVVVVLLILAIVGGIVYGLVLAFSAPSGPGKSGSDGTTGGANTGQRANSNNAARHYFHG
jgi:hypothetical protein